MRHINVCPVCRNVNQLDATICRYCGTTLTPPPPEVATPARRRPLWPWITGALALLLVLGGGVTAFSFLAGGGQAEGVTLEVGTDTGAALQFEPRSVPAPPQTPVTLVFVNRATVPHNLRFAQGSPIAAGTSEQVAPGASETLTFETPPPGSYPFTCTIHPGMDGELVVQ